MRETQRSMLMTVTAFSDEASGRQIGAMYRISTGAGPRWVGEVHDYNGDHPDGRPYDPITLGVFADPDQVRAEIAEHVRKYSPA